MDDIEIVYAVPCVPKDKYGNDDFDGLFFLTFQTLDEDKALRLASCVCGKEKAKKSLLMIDENGEIY